MKALLSILTLLVFSTSALLSQTITTKVSSKRVVLGDHFQVSFEIDGDASGFSAPSFDNFLVLSGPNKSSSMQWINGNFSSNVSYSYILRPKQEGTFTIGEASIKTSNGVVHSNPVEIAVSNSRKRTQVQPNTAKRTPQAPSPKAPENDDLSSNLFAKLYIDKKEAVLSEQLVATYKLYLNTQIVNYIPNRPVFNGFFAEDLEVDPSKEMSQEVINGQRFSVATMKKVVLTPQKTGTLEIPPLELEMIVRVQEQSRRRSIFDSFFGNYRNVKVQVNSNKETIEVKDLPRSAQPATFDGAVGQFKLLARVDRDSVQVNDAINLIVSIEGKGNLQLLGEPNITLPADFESFDPKIKDNIVTTASGTKGSKTYEYVLIPRFKGKHVIEPIKFTYYDPQSKTYKIAESDPITLNISAGKGSTSSGPSFTATKKEDVQILGKDIRFIKTSAPELKRNEDRFFRSTLFYVLAMLSFIGMGGAIFLIQFYRAQRSDVGAVKRKKAGSVAKRHLKKAKLAMEKDDDGFYEEIAQALFGYLGDKLDIPRSELDRARIESALRNVGAKEELSELLKKTLDECEMVRFAPGVVRSKPEMLAVSTQLINDLEDEL